MNELTLNQQMEAIQAISPGAHLLFNSTAGKWHVYMPDVERIDGQILCSPSSYHYDTPSAAVYGCWTDISDGRILVKNAYEENRKEYTWNGFMWKEVSK